MTDNAALFKALVQFQRSATNVAKDKQANTGKFGYSYTDIAGVIEAVKEPLAALGLCYMQVLDHVDGRPAIRTILAHESGASIEGVVTLQGDLNDPQKFGGICTYYRRYSLLGILGLATEDDDANHARTPSPATHQRQPEAQRPQQVSAPQSPPPARPGASQGVSEDEEMTWTDLYGLTRPLGYANRAALEEFIGSSIADMTPAQVFRSFREHRGERPTAADQESVRRVDRALTEKQLNTIRGTLPKKGMDMQAWTAWQMHTLDTDEIIRPDQLSISEASTIIDALYALPDNKEMQAIIEASGGVMSHGR